MSATTICDGLVSDALLKALVIYEDVALATIANSVLGRALQRAGETKWRKLKPWRLELLELSWAADDAIADAADVNLVLLALRQPESFPCWAWAWLERWATHRQVPDAAIAVFDGMRDVSHAPSMARDFVPFAQRHGLTLVCEDYRLIETESASYVQESYERGQILSPTPKQILEHLAYDRHESWGINE